MTIIDLDYERAVRRLQTAIEENLPATIIDRLRDRVHTLAPQGSTNAHMLPSERRGWI